MSTAHHPLRLAAVMLGATSVFVLSLLPTPLSAPATLSPDYLSTPLSEPAPSQARLLFGPLVAEAAPVGTNSSNSIYYRQTGHYVKDAFLNYWLMNGGVNTYGYPISEETTLNNVPVQYFQRARFEYRTQSSRPWKVELTRVGTETTGGRTFETVGPAAATGDRTYYAETGHTLGGTFGQFWKNNGGLGLFGFPISEEFRENGVTVQYFERARFELVGQGRVQLGHLGAELMSNHIAAGRIDAGFTQPVTRPGYQMSFRGNATVFNADWDRVIRLNKQWGNLPQDYVGRGLYAAAPADLHLYGRMARVTRGNRSIFVQFIDVINWPDVPYVRNKGIVIDLGQEAFEALGQYNGGRYEVSFDVFWPGEEP